MNPLERIKQKQEALELEDKIQRLKKQQYVQACHEAMREFHEMYEACKHHPSKPRFKGRFPTIKDMLIPHHTDDHDLSFYDNLGNYGYTFSVKFAGGDISAPPTYFYRTNYGAPEREDPWLLDRFTEFLAERVEL